VHERDWFFARKLNEMGVATLVLDSFAPQGLIKVFENKQLWRTRAGDRCSHRDRGVAKDRRIDFRRLGATGRSLGGQTPVRLTLKASRDQLPEKAALLNLALAITPGCTSQQHDRRMTPQSQVRLFLAEKDAAPHQRSITYVEKMRATGGDSQYKVYPDAFHVFDGSAKPVWTPKQEVYAGCENDRISPRHSSRLDTRAAS
jgi:dienelactone hydrolase